MKTIRAAARALSRGIRISGTFPSQSESPFFFRVRNRVPEIILIKVTPNEGQADVTPRTADLMAENGIRSCMSCPHGVSLTPMQKPLPPIATLFAHRRIGIDLHLLREIDQQGCGEPARWSPKPPEHSEDT
jgi:hypothetical protein